MALCCQTHMRISPVWVGEIVELSSGKATARLLTLPEMAADDRGLVHGGFTFGLADYAAMLSVNDPNVVLGAAESKFIAPVRVGEVMTAVAEVIASEGKRRQVRCTVMTDREVFSATFTCFVLPRHVLDL